MKKFLMLLFISVTQIFAQEGQVPANVELPTFVITGKDFVELPAVNKIDIPVTPKMPENNFNPVFKPIRFSRKEFKPAFQEVSVPEYIFEPQLNGGIGLSFGNINTPTAKADIMFLTKTLAVNANLTGNNSKAYVLNSERFVTKSYAKVIYHPYDAEGIFSDVNTFATLNTHYTKFRLFGSLTPVKERNLNTYDFSAGLEKGKDSPYFLNLSAGNQSTIVKEESYNGNLWDLSGNIGFHFDNFRLDARGRFLANKETQYSTILSNNFSSLEATISGIVTRLLTVRGGVVLTKNSIENKLSPVSSFELRVTDNLELGGSFQSSHQFRNNSGYIRLNNYLNNFSLSDLSFYRENEISAYIKYEAEDIVSAILKVWQYSDKNFRFVNFNPSTSLFGIASGNTEGKHLSFEISSHFGVYGTLNSNLLYSDVQLTNGLKVPGLAPLEIDFDYSVIPLSDFELVFGVNYKAPFYFTTSNLGKIGSRPLFSFGSRYSITDSFIFNLFISNLSDTKYYNWYNYLEPGRSIEAGITFNW